jgi:rRNA processing protein Gar1
VTATVLARVKTTYIVVDCSKTGGCVDTVFWEKQVKRNKEKRPKKNRVRLKEEKGGQHESPTVRGIQP